MTRVAIVETDGSGGLIHFAYQMATALSDTGADVTLHTAPHYELRHLPHRFRVDARIAVWRTTDNEPAWARRLPHGLLRLRHIVRRVWRAARFVWAWELLTRRLLRERPDVVQFSIIRFPFQELFLRRLERAGLTLTQVCHEFEARESARRSRRLTRRMSRRLYTHFSAIFFLGDAVRDEFLAEFDVDRSVAHVIPHGDESLFVTLTDAGGNLRSRYGIPDAAPVVGFFGGLRPSKGIDDLIDAFAYVRDEVPDARLIVAGLPTADVDPAEFVDRAHALGIGDAVTIDARYLPLEEVGPFVRSADVIALPYRSGTASGALQVAYAFGRPVVATTVGSVAEAIVHGETGLVVRPQDLQALARALIKVLADRAEALRMGEAGRDLAASRHAWGPIADRVMGVLERVGGR